MGATKRAWEERFEFVSDWVNTQSAHIREMSDEEYERFLDMEDEYQHYLAEKENEEEQQFANKMFSL